MTDQELKRHLEAIERYLNAADSALRCGYNRLKFLQEILRLPEQDQQKLEDTQIDVKVPS